VITGRKRHVLHGDCADHLVVAARVDGERCDRTGLALFLVDANAPGVSRRGYVTQDRQRAAEVVFKEVRVGPEATIGEPGAALPLIEQVVDQACAAICAEGVGVMGRAHEITVDYLKLRHQFGRPIGSFQALQHRAVDMLIHVEQARSMAMYGAIAGEDDDPLERRRAVSAAKVKIGRSGKQVCGEAIQLHGGIGMTDEHPIGHYYRRLVTIDLLFGDSAHHLAALARAGGLVHPEPIED
jgi:alkylation response protein AidB-like acyl-CoA dehydrogenase